MSERIIRYKEAGERLSVTPKTIKNWIKSGNLPAPIKLSPRVVGWLESDFEQAIAAKKNKNNS